MTSSNGNIFRVTGHLSREFTGSGESPTQRPVTRSFDVFFDLRLNEWLSKQSWGWWFETPRIYASPGIRKLIVSSVKALCVNTPVILLWFGRQIIFWMNTHFTNEWWARNPNPKKMRVGITWQLLIRMRKLCHSFKTVTQDRAMHHVVNRTGISALEQPVKWVGRSAKNGASTFDNCEKACDNYITTREMYQVTTTLGHSRYTPTSLCYHDDCRCLDARLFAIKPSMHPGPVFCPFLWVSSDCAQPITGQVTEVTWTVIGQAQPEFTPSKRQKTGPVVQFRILRPRAYLAVQPKLPAHPVPSVCKF